MMHKEMESGVFLDTFKYILIPYARVNEYRSKYETILNLDNVIGIDIATYQMPLAMNV
jgi:radical SAM superfamily enzyme